MVVTINGQPIANYVHVEGLSWKETDIHSDDSGRDIEGTMHITRIGSKVTLSISCKALNEEDARKLLQLLRSTPPLEVQYDDPAQGLRTMQAYLGDRNCEFLMEVKGVKWWKNIKFDLIEC